MIRIGLFLGGLLSALLLIVLPSQAAIMASLDNPNAGPQAGDNLVSGWAFAVVMDFSQTDFAPTTQDFSVTDVELSRVAGIHTDDIYMSLVHVVSEG